MFYFIGVGIGEKITGIESAQLKRLKLFKQFNEPAKIVTVNHPMARTANARRFGLDAMNFVNMYDFLCDIPFDYRHSLTIADLNLTSAGYQITSQKNQRTVMRNRDQMKIIIDVDDNGQVTWVDYFDQQGIPRIIQQIDPRGFVGIQSDYNSKRQLLQKRYFSPAGATKIVEYYRGTPTPVLSSIQYRETGGRVVQFEGRKGLLRYFFDRLNESTPNNVFVVDRTKFNAWAIEHMETRAFRVFHLHNVHANGLVDNPASVDFNNNYRQALLNLDRWQGCIVLTKHQVQDMLLNFPAKKLFNIPAVIIPPERLDAAPVPLAKRVPGRIIAVARIDRQKKLKELVTVVAMIHKQLPSVTLDIWGLTADQKYEKELRGSIKAHDLQDAVRLRGFTKDIGAEYDRAQLMILTSSAEGTVLALSEAHSHGVPVVTYDFKYGPREFIVQDENGEIVPIGDRQAAADYALALLTDNQRWTTFSQAAYRYSRRYSSERVFADWQPLKAAANEFYAKG